MDGDRRRLVYSRQESLPISIPESATVIGLGGGGFWVALELAMAGVKKLILIDGDILSELNLNRIPADETWLGKLKVEFAKSFIGKIRDCDIIAIRDHYTDGTDILVEGTVFECTDNVAAQLRIERDFGEKSENRTVVWHIHYNGFNRLSIENFIDNNEWGDAPSHYDVIPSFCAPAIAVASIGVYHALTHESYVDYGNGFVKFQKTYILPGGKK